MAIIAKCLGTAADTSPLDILTEAKFKRVGVDYGMDTHRVRLYWGTGATGTKLCTELYFPSGYDGGNGYIGISGDNSFGSFGTMKLWISQNIPDYLSDLSTEIAIPQGAVWSQSYAAAGGGGSDDIDIYLPRITAGTVILWVDRNGRTYYDESYTTVAQGTIAFLTKSETATITESAPKKSGWGYFENLPVSLFSFKYNPRHYPIEIFEMFDSIVLNSARHATIVGWQFSPDYRVMFDDVGDKKSFATTNWAPKINNYGQLRKSIRHWSGDFEVGNWTPEFADIDSELFGSMFSGTMDARYRDLSLRIMHHNKPLQYTTQFRGIIDSAEWSDGLAKITVRDLLGELPYRVFTYDYQNVATHIKGKTYGVVTGINGTNVYFEDYGTERYIQIKQKGRSVWAMFGMGAAGGALGAIAAANPLTGLAVGFGLGALGNLPTRDRVVKSYWEVHDYNAVPDDIIRTGQSLKFHPGSFSGIATNANGPLFDVVAKTVQAGTMIRGLHGTVSFQNVEGISIGDNIYWRQPMFFRGSPREVIEAILTGSNINKPYSTIKLFIGAEPEIDPVKGPTAWLPSPTLGTLYEGDFATSWRREWGGYENAIVERTFDASENVSPFEVIKELVQDLQVAFYINENNKFAVKTIRPRGLSGTEGIATYGSLNILDGFSFRRSVEDAKAGIRVFYDWIGEGGAYGDGYNSLLERPFKRRIKGIEDWVEVESKWIKDDDTADMVAWRSEAAYGTGMDRVTIPTTLYGAMNSVTDLVKVYHRMGNLSGRTFEIEETEKDFTRSRVTLQAVDIQGVYGMGNDIWHGTQEPTGTYDISGYSWFGPLTMGTIGTVNATMAAGIDYLDLGMRADLRSKFARYIGHLVTFGTGGQPGNRGWEVALVEGVEDSEWLDITMPFPSVTYRGGLVLRRGLFNTIEQHILPGKYIYDLGLPTSDPQTSELLPTQIQDVSFIAGTTKFINSNLGTAFRFF